MTTESPSPTRETAPTASDIRRWRRYLADERAEAAVYRDLANRRSGEEREILLGLAEAESRHEAHWIALLGDQVGHPQRGAVRTRVLGFLARNFGSVFVLALAQRAEGRSPYSTDVDATATMAADEQIHAEVVRGLAERGRNRLSGTFRAAVFGANDGLVSNLSLIMGVGAAGVPTSVILITGIAGLLSGALSMGAGEFVSVRSQRELLEASTPDPEADRSLPDLDIDANELALLYRARGMNPEDAQQHAIDILEALHAGGSPRLTTGPGELALETGGEASELASAGADAITEVPGAGGVHGNSEAPANTADTPGIKNGRVPEPAVAAEVRDEHEAIGTGLGAALSSFCFFASGAIIPILPYLFGMSGLAAVILSAALVGIALLATGAIVGLLSGASPVKRGLRQLLIGYGAATVTYLLGLAFGTTAL